MSLVTYLRRDKSQKTVAAIDVFHTECGSEFVIITKAGRSLSLKSERVVSIVEN